ncbi:MAG: hypothetical protein ACLUKQ_01815 [Peptococcaceae bacterium]
MEQMKNMVPPIWHSRFFGEEDFTKKAMTNAMMKAMSSRIQEIFTK